MAPTRWLLSFRNKPPIKYEPFRVGVTVHDAISEMANEKSMTHDKVEERTKQLKQNSYIHKSNYIHLHSPRIFLTMYVSDMLTLVRSAIFDNDI